MHTNNPLDIRIAGVSLYFLPVETRVPLKFGPETLTSVTCARVAMTVEDAQGRRGVGWGRLPRWHRCQRRQCTWATENTEGQEGGR